MNWIELLSSGTTRYGSESVFRSVSFAHPKFQFDIIVDMWNNCLCGMLMNREQLKILAFCQSFKFVCGVCSVFVVLISSVRRVDAEFAELRERAPRCCILLILALNDKRNFQVTEKIRSKNLNTRSCSKQMSEHVRSNEKSERIENWYAKNSSTRRSIRDWSDHFDVLSKRTEMSTYCLQSNVCYAYIIYRQIGKQKLAALNS